MRVLVVDDNEDNVCIMESLLKNSGYDVFSSIDGEDALERLKCEKIDLIISDILMPKMDGFQLCRRCKNDKKLRQTPFIFYTSTYTSKGDEEFAARLAADRYVRKPVDVNELLAS